MRTLKLISIGLIAEDGREFYAELSDTYTIEDCGDFARACLLARRLIERGVRFVQLWSGAAFGGDVHWDAHGSVPGNHRREAERDIRMQLMRTSGVPVFHRDTDLGELGADE